jgi:opacity protein-like surface antigen
MKLALLTIFSAAALCAQLFSLGVKAGLPLTDFIDTVSSSHASVNTVTNRYVVGPTAELHLPFGLGVEVDVLYRHFNYNSTANLVDAISSVRATASDWEFPLLVKKRFGVGPILPFVDAGVNFNKVSGLSRTVSILAPNLIGSTSSSELKNDFTAGFTLGAGVQLNLLLLKITPEIRYTRWGNQQFNGIFPAGGSLTSNQNQAEFLVGFSF